MNHVYRSHSLFSHLTGLVLRIVLLALTLIWSMPLIALGWGAQPTLMLFRFPLVVSLSTIIAGLLVSAAARDRRNLSIIMSEESITKDTPTKRQILPYTGLLGFQYVRVPFIGGRAYLRAPSGQMILPLTIANAHGLVAALRARLQQENRQDLLASADVDRFLRDSVAANRALSRLLRSSVPLFRVTTLFFAGNVIIASFFWGLYLPLTLLWACLSTLFPLVGFISAQSWIFGVERRSNAEMDERRVLLICGLLTTILYLLVGIFVSRTW